MIVAVIGAIAKNYFEGKPKLITFLVHSIAHPMPPDPTTGHVPSDVHTHTIVVMNTGNKTAHNVRIDHAYLPLSYVLTPPINYSVTRGQGSSAEICVPVLVPNEQISISYLYFPPVTWSQINAWVKCDEGMAKTIQVIPSIPPPKHLLWFLRTLTFIGATTVVYWLLRALPTLLK